MLYRHEKQNFVLIFGDFQKFVIRSRGFFWYFQRKFWLLLLWSVCVRDSFINNSKVLNSIGISNVMMWPIIICLDIKISSIHFTSHHSHQILKESVSSSHCSTALQCMYFPRIWGIPCCIKDRAQHSN